MTSGQPTDGPGEPPQAIAEDYPGWGIRHDNGHWTAWCPAITLHAPTATELARRHRASNQWGRRHMTAV